MADEEAGASRPQLELPPIGFGGHLVDLLFEIGPSTGGEVVTFQEIQAWSGQTGVSLDAWESVMIRRLSAAFLDERFAATDPARPPPFSAAPAKSRQEVACGILQMMQRLAAQHEAQEKGANRRSVAPVTSRRAKR